MSRIGNKPVEINDKVEISLGASSITVKGPKGELTTEIVDERIKFELSEGELVFSRTSENPEVRSLHGLYRSLVANNIQGVLELSLIHISSPRDRTRSRMPSSA